jgi:hypothetical protein
MGDDSADQVAAPHRAAARFGLPAAAAAAVGVAVWIAGVDQERTWSGYHLPRWCAPVFALATAGAVVAIATLTRTRRAGHLRLAALGVVVVALGSGIGRARVEVHLGAGGGDLVARLDARWVVVALGLVLAVGSAVHARRAHLGGTATILSSSYLAAVALGYAVVTVAMRDVVTGTWISGRPLRSRVHRAAREGVDTKDPCAGALWRAAAADEAEAVLAFSDLAERLTRVGAPTALIGRCQEAAREERRHAATCTWLASHFGSPSAPNETLDHDGPTSRPAPARRSRSRRTEVIRLATESFIDGVAGEGFAAGRLEAGAATVAGGQGPRLGSMAREERSHAALGGDIVRWALQEHPGLVSGALRGASRRLPTHVDLPAAYQGLPPEDLHRVGFTDAPTAAQVWTRERAAAHRWLAEALRSESTRSTLSPG